MSVNGVTPTASHVALTNARLAVTAIERQIAELDAKHAAALTELEAAKNALTKQLGAEQLGESDASASAAARELVTAAERAVSGLAAGRAVLTARLPAAVEAGDAALKAFQDEAATALQPERERLAQRLQSLATELQSTLQQFARVDAVTSGIPLGCRTGASLMRAAGLDEQQLTLSIGREPPRLSAFEILEIMSATADR